jgi:uncharacterized membrane protein
MGHIELNIAIMAGLVLSLFLIVGEIAALRTQASRLREHWKQLYMAAKFLRAFAEICGVAAFFLVQPFIVAILVLLALNGFNPNFSVHVFQQLQQDLTGVHK